MNVKTAACAIALSLFLLLSALPAGAISLAAPETDAGETGVSAAGEAEAEAADAGTLFHARLLERLTEEIAPVYAALRVSDQSLYGNVAASADTYAEMATAVTAAVEGALLDAAKGCKSAANVAVRYPERAFTWQEAAALARAFGNGAADVLSEQTALSERTDANGKTIFAAELPTISQALSAKGTEERMAGLFTLCYLNTVFDGAGQEKAYEKYPFTAEYLRTVAHPLPDGVYWIKNGWYLSRDGGDRLHTGADITAPARTKIHAATDGVVTDVGFMKTPGNFVVIRDAYGFEYHYYHMIKRTEQVKVGDVVRQGDWIGLVGNTGNSSRAHLHLTVISPEYTYINPYDLFLAAGIGPIRNG